MRHLIVDLSQTIIYMYYQGNMFAGFSKKIQKQTFKVSRKYCKFSTYVLVVKSVLCSNDDNYITF